MYGKFTFQIQVNNYKRTIMKNFLLIYLSIVLFSSCDLSQTDRQLLSQNEYDSLNNASNLLIKNTFDTLKNTLTKTIGDSGIGNAIQVCNFSAHELESVYANDNMQIRRTSTKYRNVNNKPNELENTWLNKFQESISKKQEPGTTSLYENGEFHFFKPIIIQPLCLSCHGNPSQDIQVDVMKRIDSLYPNDLAKGYKNGELRALWHVIIKYEPKK